ncbi:hypothetical protein IFM89_007015 [Coptis chinensis]|uniref:Uncharacterized protein n=1 Tax=Coptis chinensis TaxID=261450 RepID=A0A835IKC6_9MAGN|nr:hypothetical protein IFM89_007015 [Coptis chinensis]
MAREGPSDVLTPESISSPLLVRSFDEMSPTELNPWQRKRMKFSDDPWLCREHAKSKYKRDKVLLDVVDYSDPFSIPNLMEKLDHGIYGSVAKDIEDLCARQFQMLQPAFSLYPSLSNHRQDALPQSPISGSPVMRHKLPQAIWRLLSSEIPQDLGFFTHSGTSSNDYGKQDGNDMRVINETVQSTVLRSNQKASWHYQEIVVGLPSFRSPLHRSKERKKPSYVVNSSSNVLALPNKFQLTDVQNSQVVRKDQGTLNDEAEPENDKGLYVGVKDDELRHESSRQCDLDDGLGDIWGEMTVALGCIKDVTADIVEQNEDEGEECGHSFVLKDDLGFVCRVSGVIKKSIETIFDYQWGKVSKTTRTYMSEYCSSKQRDKRDTAPLCGVNSSHDLTVFDISVHPRHMKQMKGHQLEGFNFLVRNLISDDPGGCILAHAPGSGKTFMIISFIQSFLAKYPHARPLVVLPKGILAIWKKVFAIWQVEDFPLYDFYSSKAESREEQLRVLKEWVDHKGILFLGYKQFANIVSKSEINSSAAACHDILLQVPTILICDEGHTPRNEDTDVLSSLAKVQTPRKVVLSGTLFQNHVKEVFNILNLVRPKFLKSDTSKTIKRRIMGRAQISGERRQVMAKADDAVEETLQNDENLKRKVTVIQDLREMTSKVLHYYKGDFLDELPGLADFTVLLNLSPRQRRIIDSLKNVEKFKRTAISTAVYLHPLLKVISEGAAIGDKGCRVNEEKLDMLLENLDVRDGVKAKFFLNILGLCESSGEKLLVFSQYLLPLKFLERLVVHTKGWGVGKEIFMITGNSRPEDREESMERFNSSSDAKVFFGSIKACGEGISLVGASRILIMDVHLNPSVTRQTIGRAFRPGQVRKVYIYRLVASDPAEEENHKMSFRKELISKMWFEWTEFSANPNFEMEKVNLSDSGDEFWQCPSLREDAKDVCRRLVKVLPIDCVVVIY